MKYRKLGGWGRNGSYNSKSYFGRVYKRNPGYFDRGKTVYKTPDSRSRKNNYQKRKRYYFKTYGM